MRASEKIKKEIKKKTKIVKDKALKQDVVEDKKIKKNVAKDRQTKNEIARLTKIFKDIDKNKKLSAKGLIEEAAYMKSTLKELKSFIDENGAIDEMQQGSYTILRENPALKSYNTMIQRYTTVIKELINLLPKDIQKETSDGFDEFVGGRLD